MKKNLNRLPGPGSGCLSVAALPMAGYPPTATIAALSYRTAEYIIRQRE